MHVENLKYYIQNLPAEHITLGDSELKFATSENFQEYQIGCRVDANGKSLISGQQGAWQKSWYTFAYDEMGDPILIDTNQEDFPVFTAPGGKKNWELTCIADSFVNFIKIVLELLLIAQGRASKTELENNPIPERTKQSFLDFIAANNKKAELWFWAMMLEVDIDLTIKKYSF